MSANHKYSHNHSELKGRKLGITIILNIIIKDISKRICSIGHVQNIHHVHVWQLYDKHFHFEAHVDLKKNLTLSEVNEIFTDIRKMLHDEFNIGHVTLQPEFNACDEKDLVTQEH